MTTEDDFQKHLDRHPNDHNTRLVFADWLDEHDDPRAEGYRALGRWRLYTETYEKGYHEFSWYDQKGVVPDLDNRLPTDWFDLIEGGEQMVLGEKVLDASEYWGRWLDWPSRRAAEDAAAVAFSLLPVDRRTELLRGRPE